MLSLDYEKYIGLVCNGEINEAIKYRRDIMPRTIYKFYSIMSEDGMCERDQLILKTLGRNQIWCSKIGAFNDPYEGVGYYLNDIDAEMERKWADCLRIASFTENASSNISMWAYYANNHKGFCVEYDVIENRFLYDVNYIEFRKSQSDLFMEAVRKKFLGESTEKEELLIFEKYLTKHISWSNEREYRIIYAIDSNDESGKCFSCNEIGLKPHKIYAGINCSDKVKNLLTEISLNLGCGRLRECNISNNEFKLL